MANLDERFSTVGNFVARGANRVNQRLVEVLREAANRFPGYRVEAYSGYRPGDRRQHGRGKAVDVRLIDVKTGKQLPNYQHSGAFRVYEQFAQTVKQVQREIAPELDKTLRWGGYFSGKPGNYGALDTMHFDVAGDVLGMKGGSWEGGLTAKQRGYFPGIESVGMGGMPPSTGFRTTPASPPLPSPRPPSPLQSAPVSAVQRAPLGPVNAPRQSVGVPLTDRAPQQPAASIPSARPQQQPGVDPRVLAAYQQMAQSRMAAPLNPVQAPTPTPQPAMGPPQQPAAPPLGPPRTITPRPVFNLPPEQFPSAPSLPSQPRDPFGNTWQDGPMGREVTNRFGVTTVQRPDGTTAAMGGPFANMDTSKLGSMAKTGLGGGLGAMLGGSLAGPLGALAGGFMGRELANGRNPMSGGSGFLGGLFGSRDPWAGTRESSGRTTSASSSRSSTSAGSKRDTRDRPDMR